ncbi:MAG: pentapeptide repeat-containing protein [Terracidiphilus sp.]|nr:pentapeptide repeat-containing protein [Terracidiphilus sp.]
MAQSSSTEQQLEPRCQVLMCDGKPCGRPIHPAPAHDEQPVCLMHSKDPSKNDKTFHNEFEIILIEAKFGNSIADFTRFIFPTLNYCHKVIQPYCVFWHASFVEGVNLSGSRFEQCVDFRQAYFGGNAEFNNTTFADKANFSGSTFRSTANFEQTTFSQEAEFFAAVFAQSGDFILAKFLNKVNFRAAKFKGCADFRVSLFTGDADFLQTIFSNGTQFYNATFVDAVNFQNTYFRPNQASGQIIDFTHVKFIHPETARFYGIDLSHTIIHNTDVSKIDFTLIEWNRRTKSRFRLFDEVVGLEFAGALEPLKNTYDERNYSLIAETYQQLKRNYDAKGDYWTAGHWHYGEMEMKRLHSRWRNKTMRWLSQNFCLAALYKYASEYGESYARPLLWLATILLSFSLLYPLIGVYPTTGLDLNLPNAASTAKDAALNHLNYWNYKAFFAAHPYENPQGIPGLLLHGLMTSLSVAGFQKELRYMPGYPWGRLLALFEILLTTTLAGLFALAIRRQFKRS